MTTLGLQRSWKLVQSTTMAAQSTMMMAQSRREKRMMVAVGQPKMKTACKPTPARCLLAPHTPSCLMAAVLPRLTAQMKPAQMTIGRSGPSQGCHCAGPPERPPVRWCCHSARTQSRSGLGRRQRSSGRRHCPSLDALPRGNACARVRVVERRPPQRRRPKGARE